MRILIENVKKLVYEELNRANNKFGPFNSTHEGAAVILEELEETLDEVNAATKDWEHLWNSVKCNSVNSLEEAIDLENTAVRMAAEAIQLSAMCKKFKNLFNEGDKTNDKR